MTKMHVPLTFLSASVLSYQNGLSGQVDLELALFKLQCQFPQHWVELVHFKLNFERHTAGVLKVSQLKFPIPHQMARGLCNNNMLL